jgi:VanZ family protein
VNLEPLNRVLLWLPACAQMALIFATSSVPGTEIPGTIWDKLVHFMVYAVLGVCFLLPLAGGKLSGVTLSAVSTAAALSMLYGICDEVHQAFTPNRTPDAFDVVADTIGATAGAALFLLVRALARPGSPAAPDAQHPPV